MRFGVIGFGRFGQLWANRLVPYGEVLVYEKNLRRIAAKPQIRMTNLQDTVQTDVLFILVPISEFENVCVQIKPILHPDTLVVDCCSVKIHSIEVMKRTFPSEQAWLATHPLFGPDSTEKNGGLKGQKIVICENQSVQDTQSKLWAVFQEMGLEIVVMTPQEHDINMARSQALMHFLGRGLASLGLDKQTLATPGFHALLDMQKTINNDQMQLFLDIQRYNVYTREMRRSLLEVLTKIHQDIERITPA